jgi:Reverse transcriptase (RNA-dependent DNA polymerase).
MHFYEAMYTDDKHLMHKEQDGCCRESKGCKDQLLLQKAILQECKSRKKNICMAWMDYQKAFDNVSHIWVIKSLKLIGINYKIISYTQKTMNYLKTNMCLYTEEI